MSALRQLFAHSDDAIRPLAAVQSPYPGREVEWLSALSRPYPVPDASVSVRSTRSTLSQYAARKIR